MKNTVKSTGKQKVLRDFEDIAARYDMDVEDVFDKAKDLIFEENRIIKYQTLSERYNKAPRISGDTAKAQIQEMFGKNIKVNVVNKIDTPD